MVKKKSKKSGKKEDAPEEKDEIAEDQNEKGGEELPEEKEVSEDQDEREVDELSEEKKGGKDDSDEKDEAKGRLVVSQRERDEIDAVVDAFWAFIDATKKAPKLILLAGIFLTIMGASFAGWPQNAFDLEVDDKSGVWLLITSSDYEMSRGSDGYYANFEPDDSVWVEGELNEIQYFLWFK